ncbi:MAG: hypothetical protein JWP25_4715 [Bradyrhizobium sp.]|nr:hypothetical protein [Bradyrhizobium sp.]
MSSNRDGYVESKPMNAMSDVSTINRFAAALENSEARRLGIRTVEARGRIAGRLGVSPGTLENFRRLRTKVVPNWLMNKVRAELVSVLQLEIQRLEHEVHIARQTGSNYRDDTLASAETQLAKARELLLEKVK